MPVTTPTLATIVLIASGVVLSFPVLYKGFRRRGKGIKYEENFLIQRAPQLASFVNVLFIVLGFIYANSLLSVPPLSDLFTVNGLLPEPVVETISWLGVVILISGLIFMIGGWYSLGDCFSTDAEVLDGHTVRKGGLLKYVMHPAYSGIIQTLLGLSLASASIFSALFTVLVVAPLWLKRAKYEEQLLIDNLGPSYMEYAKELKWRRLVPIFFPIGV